VVFCFLPGGDGPPWVAAGAGGADVGRGEAGGGLGSFAVDADLAGAAEFLDGALGEGGEMAAEPAVEADIGLVGGDFFRGDGHGVRSWRSFSQ